MIQKDKFGEVSGTTSEWEDFYKWAEKNKKMDKPFGESIEEYIKLNNKVRNNG